jgi:hypothetical protein
MLTSRLMSAEQVIECTRTEMAWMWGNRTSNVGDAEWQQSLYVLFTFRFPEYRCVFDRYYSRACMFFSLFAFLSTDVCSTDTTQCLLIGYSLWRLHFFGWVIVCMCLCSWTSCINTRLLSSSLDCIYFVQVDMGYTVFPLLNCTSVHAYLFCSFSGRNHVLITYWLFCFKDVQVTCILCFSVHQSELQPRDYGFVQE